MARLSEFASFAALVLSAMLLLMGCPSTPQKPTQPPDANAADTAATAPPNATAAPTAQPGVTGSWSVAVTSSSPSINPALFDTAEKKAKVFFDHQARVVGTKIVVTHHTLRRDFPLKDAATATRFDQLVSSVDWEAMKKKVAAEEPSEGATQFRFQVTRDEVTTEFETTNLETYSELTEIVKTLKETVGLP